MECDNIASPGVPGFANLRMAPRSLEEILPQINPGHGRGPEPAAHRGENAGNSAARYTGRQPVDQTEIVPPGLRLNSVRRRSAADREFWRLNGAVSKTSGGVPSSVALSPFVTQRLGFWDHGRAFVPSYPCGSRRVWVQSWVQLLCRPGVRRLTLVRSRLPIPS
jgi:hypothetical protein